MMFLKQYRLIFKANPRMGLMLNNWEKRGGEERASILQWAGRELDRLAPITS